MIRFVIFFYLFLFTIFMFAQDGYTLYGKIENTENAYLVYLYYPIENEYVIDSCDITNGLFRFSGFVEYPVLATLELRNKDISSANNSSDVFYLYLENAPIMINMDREGRSIISGSRTHDLHMEFLRLLEPLKEEMNNIRTAYNNATPQQQESQVFNDSLMICEQNVRKMNSQCIYKFVKEHPDSFISLYLLQSQLDNIPDDEQILVAFSSMSSIISESLPGKNLANKLQKIKATSVGATAPDFECADIEGRLIKLSDFRGKRLLLVFWASDCSHCLVELSNLEKVFSLFRGKDFTILAVALDPVDRKKEWETFVRNNKLSWTNLFDERINGKKKIAGLYNIHKTPSCFLLDRDGKIIAKDLYGESLLEKLAGI
ncbi:AhpC/TSA family protein [Dysgonomonas sp. Marseille-P4677]|uniref:TlpA disulfide reductase family protein n=1 Tax=Dysgonomonas sp. Marseille-P4677 TaxID=2364790 RepID=UPI001911F655|nr:TlpA disulfide reductase family protein [Dysgonomonas sp. Marseille-P4677]MBK5721105.1 AhpC/TSA family protein [Dysgonomonas sp. Marseille-P4677]